MNIKKINVIILSISILTLIVSCSKDNDNTPTVSIPFVSIWKTLIPDQEITIYTNPSYTSYNYTVDWGDGETSENQTTDATHSYAIKGDYTISITGDFPAIYNIADATNANATDAPDLSNVTSLQSMFINTTFNTDLNHWDVSNVENMASMFADNNSFNGDISNWDVSEVYTMVGMFTRATSFNQDISSWNVGKVEYMTNMFNGASSFKQQLGNWATNNVTGCDDFATDSALIITDLPVAGSCAFENNF